MQRLWIARALTALLLAVTSGCLLACGESPQIAPQPTAQPASSETAEQSQAASQPTKGAAQQAQPEHEPSRTSQSATVEDASDGQAGQTEQSQTVAAREPATGQSTADQRKPQSDTQQAQAEQDQNDDAPEQPVLRLWDHDGDNPSGLFHELITPIGYDPSTPIHLVLYLPDRTGSGGVLHSAHVDAIKRVAIEHGVAMLMPYSFGEHGHWNAADGCCEREPQSRDPVSFYRRLINEARQHIDVNRFSIIGEYAGGWMAYRLACEGLPGLSAIAVLEASFYGDRARCDGARPLSVFHVHPTGYGLWRYLWQGGERMGWTGGVFAYPGAEELARRWADRAGCELSAAQPAETLSDRREETVRLRWTRGCTEGIAIELWGIATVAEGVLQSLLSFGWSAGVLDWLDAQAQVRDLNEPFQPGAEPVPRPIESGVWTRESALEFLVLDTSPPSTLVRPHGVSPSEPLTVVLPLPGSHGDVWHDADKWVDVLGAEHFAVLLPGQGYRGTESNPAAATHNWASPERQELFQQMIELAQEHVVIEALYLSGDSAGSFEAYWSARRCLPHLNGVITGAVAHGAHSAPGGCERPSPISVLHRLGTEDAVASGNADTMREWADLAGCDLDPERLPNIDVDWSLPGDETEILRWRGGCRDGITVELWRVVGAGHHFGNPNIGQQLVEWMLNEARVES